MFPTSDMVDGFAQILERNQIQEALIDAYPQLAERIEVDDARPLLKIPTGRGGAVVIWKGTDKHITRWRIGCPQGADVVIHEPESMDEYPSIVAEALGLDA